MERSVTSVSFAESTDIVTMFGGGKSDAGFVQVMLGHVVDRARLDALNKRMGEVESVLSKVRPDVIGEVIALHDDGTYTEVVYFTSEAAARAGEAAMQELPADAQAIFDELTSAVAVDDYLDISDPVLH